MNTFSKITAMALLPLTVAAQQGQPTVFLYHFAVDGSAFYDISGGVPGSPVSFYSQPGGGRRIATATLGADGHVRIEQPKGFAPALVFSVHNVPAGMPAGNGNVTFAREREFSLAHLQKQEYAGQTMISWEAATSSTEPIRFELWKHTAAGAWQQLTTVPGQGAAMQAYSFTDGNSAQADYELRIINEDRGLRYAKTALAAPANAGGGVLIYPTLVSTFVKIVLPANTTSGTYRIDNSMGQQVAAGNLGAPCSEITLGNIAAGDYTVSVTADGQMITGKIVKR